MASMLTFGTGARIVSNTSSGTGGDTVNPKLLVYSVVHVGTLFAIG